jgi:preprotein translocase subunit SecD
MLYFSRWKALSILLTAVVVCAFAVPNFVSAERVKTWPQWAQRSVVLGLDLQGGSHILLQVDSNDVINKQLEILRGQVAEVRTDLKNIWASPPIKKGNSVEVRLREDDKYQAVLAELRALSQPITNTLVGVTGQKTLDVIEVGGGLVRLTPTEAAINERIRQVVEQSIPIIERRINGLGLVEPTIQRQGMDRILVQVPGLDDPQKLIDFVGPAKLEFRLINETVPVRRGVEGNVPTNSDARVNVTIQNQ